MQQKNLTDEALLTFGWGDGGGGPSPEMVEILRRETHGLPGLPTATHEFAGDFLKRLEKKIDKNPDLPEWRGELYLEFHRGTYTSQAANKRNNRKSEFLFQNAEMLSEMTRVLLGCDYPAEELGEGWETILTNQFHDIIPGSSIREVYERCEKDYARVKALGEGAVSRATDAIVQAVDTEEEYLVFNPHSFPHSGPVKMGGETVFVENVPAKGYMAYTPKAAPCRVKIEGRRVETPHFRVIFDGEYRIASLYDKKAKRRVLSGKGNVLEVYEDIPYNYDAWELCSYYKEKKAELLDVASVCTVEDGCRKGLRITRRHMASLFVQTVWFYDSVPRIDFENEIDWKQEHQVLKVLFPVDVNSDRATYEVQFGAVERPTHTNTSWDRMKFEVCAHKYADLSDNGYGVSMLNDCKYGHDIHGNEMRLTLLKCATHPDPMADKCHHTFTYSIYPHAGALKDGDTLRQAYDLNLPMTAVKAKRGTGRLPERFSLLSVKAQGVIAETVKKAYDSEDTVIRMYEAKNMTEKAVLTFGFPVAEVWECDLEENPIRALPVKNGSVRLELKPFEILTLKAIAPKEEA
jgi:alpha-mannosidase